MKCPICEKGTLRPQMVDVVMHGLFIGHFKADVCSYCGERIFDSSEVEKTEAKLKEMGLWNPEPTKVYKIGANIVIPVKKKIATAMGLTKDSHLKVIAQAKQKRLIVEFA